MRYAIDYDVGDRKRDGGINEDSVSMTVFEDGHRDGLNGAADQNDGDSDPDDGERAAPPNRSVATFALADGAGGHDAGDVASYLATTVIPEELSETAIRAARSDPAAFDVDLGGVEPERPEAADLRAAVADAIEAAHREVLRYAAEGGQQAYATVVAGIYADGQLHYGWVGDSRAYVLNAARGELARLTKDHSVVEELRDAGEIDEVASLVHPRGNEITRAIGGTGAADPETATVEVETDSVPVFAEDVLVVTSDGVPDGLTDAPALYERYVESGHSEPVAGEIRELAVTDDEIRDAVLSADSLESAAADLIGLANDRGGKDNLSVLLWNDPAAPSTPEAGGLPVRARDPPEPIEDRETVLLPED